MTANRAENILLRLEHFPKTIKHAKRNLDLAVRPFAEATIATLADIEPRLRRMEAGLAPVFPEDLRSRLHRATGKALRPQV